MQVLEIGTISSKRHPSDILPFLPMFRKLFQNLPSKAASMNLKVTKIPLADLECVTNTQVKIGGPIWYLNIKKEAIKFGDKELPKYTSSWLSNAWDELDWSRVKELQVRDILDKRRDQVQIMQSCSCVQCPNFLKHVSGLRAFTIAFCLH